DFTVSSAFVAAYLGESCQVYYEVIRGGASTQSKTLSLEVEALASQEWDLVSIPEATGGVIETSGAYTVRIDAWPFMVAGQLLTVFLRGTTDTLLFSRPVTAAEVTAGRVTAPIPADYLRTLAADSTLRVEANVSLDGSGNQATAQAFEVARYDVRRSAGIVGTITVGNAPAFMTLSPDNKKLYVGYNNLNTVHVISTETNAIVHTIPLQAVARGLVVSPDSSRLYVGLLSNTITLYEYETTFYTTVQTSNVNYTTYFMARNPSGSRLYQGYFSYIYSYDTFNLRITAPTFSLGVNKQLSSIIMNSDGTRLYAGNSHGLMVFTAAGVVIRDLQLALPNPYFNSLALSPNKPRLYANSSTGENSYLGIFDTDTITLVKSIPGFRTPLGLVFNPDPAVYRAYVTENTGNSVRVIDTEAEESIASITGFDRPFGIVFNSDSNTLYVANNGTNTISVVNV
ncbi:YncE family protein, partial [Pseudomonas capeferrum]